MRILLPQEWQVPSKFAKRLGDDVGRQRLMSAEGHLLLVLHEPPSPGITQRKGRFFWRDPEGAWRSKPLGDGVQTLKRHVTEFAECVEALEKQWQAAECAEAYYLLIRAIAPLHRTTRNLHAVLQEARDLIPEDRDLINLRDQVNEIERALELIHGDAKNGLDFTVAHQAEQQSQRAYEMAVAAHRLNLLAATFFPLATLSAVFGAIFGMMHAHNDHGLEGVSMPPLFWTMMAVGLVCGVVLARLIARKPAQIKPPAVPVKGKRRRWIHRGLPDD